MTTDNITLDSSFQQNLVSDQKRKHTKDSMFDSIQSRSQSTAHLKLKQLEAGSLMNLQQMVSN